MAAVLAFLQANQGVLLGFVIALIDLVFAINSSAKANGILQWMLNEAQTLLGQVNPKA